MPIDGFPDAELHKICFRCRQWFEPDEGGMMLPEVLGPVSLFRNIVARITEDESLMRFMCRRCRRVRRVTKVIIAVVLVVLLGTAVVLDRFRG